VIHRVLMSGDSFLRLAVKDKSAGSKWETSIELTPQWPLVCHLHEIVRTGHPSNPTPERQKFLVFADMQSGVVLPDDDDQESVQGLLLENSIMGDFPDEYEQHHDPLQRTAFFYISDVPVTPCKAGQLRAPPVVDMGSLDAAKKWLSQEATTAVNSPSIAQIEKVVSCCSSGEVLATYNGEPEHEHEPEVPPVRRPNVPVAPRIPVPNYLDWALLIRMGVGYMLLSQGMTMSQPHAIVLLVGSFFYYFMETGIFHYWYRKYMATEPGQDQNAAWSYTPAVLQIFVGVPRAPGPIADMVALIGSFCFSLMPTWDPRGGE
jgi:hypothetical protein